jgi:hypothetical protein
MRVPQECVWQEEEIMTRYLIDPFNLTDYERSDSELQTLFVFSVCVAGKRADQTAKKVESLLWRLAEDDGLATQTRKLVLEDDEGLEAFSLILNSSRHGRLTKALMAERMGQYGRISGALNAAAEAWWDNTKWPRDASPEWIESNIPGVGPKTARLFVLHSRPNQRFAALDTHILQWLAGLPESLLKAHGIKKVPQSTPTSRKLYLNLEGLFLDRCDALGRQPADLDLDLWKQMTRSKDDRTKG